MGSALSLIASSARGGDGSKLFMGSGDGMGLHEPGDRSSGGDRELGSFEGGDLFASCFTVDGWVLVGGGLVIDPRGTMKSFIPPSMYNKVVRHIPLEEEENNT